MSGPNFLGAGPLLIDSEQNSYFLNGNVGIGLNGPTSKLHIKGTDNVYLQIESGTASFIRPNDTGGSQNSKLFDIINDGGMLHFRAINDDYSIKGERLFIDANGNVGIGTANPTHRLCVKDGVDVNLLVRKASDFGEGYSGVGLQSVNDNNSANLMLTLVGNPIKLIGGDVNISGNAEAANNIKVYDSLWFAISALGDAWKDHGLQTIPKGVIVLCAASATPSEVSVAGPTVTHWHNWAKQGEPSLKGDDIGAFVRMTASQIYVRAGDRVGWHSGAWQSSGYYKIIAWA